MASQSQGIQQLLQAEKRAAEKVSEARKREFRGGAAGRGAMPRSAARPREVAGGEARNSAGRRGGSNRGSCATRRPGSEALEDLGGDGKLPCGIIGLAWRHNNGRASSLVSGRRVKRVILAEFIVFPPPTCSSGGCPISVKGATICTVAPSRKSPLCHIFVRHLHTRSLPPPS